MVKDKRLNSNMMSGSYSADFIILKMICTMTPLPIDSNANVLINFVINKTKHHVFTVCAGYDRLIASYWRTGF